MQSLQRSVWGHVGIRDWKIFFVLKKKLKNISDTPSSERSGTFQNELTFFVEGVETFPAVLVFFRDSSFLHFKDIKKSSLFAEKFNFEIKILISLALLSVTYHIFSGIRHMIADFTSYGHELDSARLTAIISFLLTFIFFVLILFEVW